MNKERRKGVHNAPYDNHTPVKVTVTHQHHVLFGQSFEFVRLRGKEPLVVVRLPGGKTARLPIDYTDYGSTQPLGDVAYEGFDGRCLLEIRGLLRAAELVTRIKKRLPVKS